MLQKVAEALIFGIGGVIVISVLMEFRWHNRALTIARLVFFVLLTASAVIIGNGTLIVVSTLGVVASVTLLAQPNPRTKAL
ncbi:hypothetical protein COU97_01685 [Candidatus Shapirobacteria bacterium CG10_big_fil_rev_8_21_14_0_10_48_15]|uniref:Uncharacterized protein n=1 Tax=Candidatus Shapirobacteria bacterium CG10_big_fil_rev_8_21_14_0_10_48_15 TaxID=1974484 RepID=A0A2M8L745_9BACT|nr:MAG: hypothetical protein COU97_01685 [Candidatus Shapirobacteria bacterium CG10_big_fil_rev_8_21_14_0_10_48_15]